MIVQSARAAARRSSLRPAGRLRTALRKLARQLVGLVRVQRQDRDGPVWIPVLTVIKQHEPAAAIGGELELKGLGVDRAGRDGDDGLDHDGSGPFRGKRPWARPVVIDRGPWIPVLTCLGVPLGCRVPDTLTDRDGADHA